MQNNVKVRNLFNLGGKDPKGSNSTGPSGFYKLKLRGTVKDCNIQGNFAHIEVFFTEDSEINVDEFITKDRFNELSIKKNGPVTVEFITSSVKI